MTRARVVYATTLPRKEIIAARLTPAMRPAGAGGGGGEIKQDVPSALCVAPGMQLVHRPLPVAQERQVGSILVAQQKPPRQDEALKQSLDPFTGAHALPGGRPHDKFPGAGSNAPEQAEMKPPPGPAAHAVT